MPLSLSDEEMALLRSLAEPVAYGRRREFLCEVAAALEAVPQSGPGVLFRVAREVQRKMSFPRSGLTRGRACASASARWPSAWARQVSLSSPRAKAEPDGSRSRRAGCGGRLSLRISRAS
jgi:hypothetical protein